MAGQRIQRRLAAIVSADIVGYSKLMGQDETGTLERVKALRSEFLHPKIAEYGGRIVKTVGDGTLIEFGSAIDAVSHAVDVQRGMVERNANLPEEQQIHLRIGINVGDVIIDGEDIFGDGVNVAARLESLADAGGICIAARVFDYVRGQPNLVFDDLGEQALKNIANPVRAYRVRLTDDNPTGMAPTGTNPPLPDKPSVAVLPFVNMSDDPDQEFFADGITEDIITDLSKLSGLFVIGRQSSFVYKGKSVGLRQIGRELGVRYVMEGSVRKAGNRVRITAQLIETETDNHVWADRYDRDLNDVFAVQEEVARKVVDTLAVKLVADEGERLGQALTHNREAYEMFVRGRKAVHPPTKHNLVHARTLFESAIELDPGFAGGYAGLSYLTSLGLLFGHIDKSQATVREAIELARKGVALDDRFGWAFTALCWAEWIGGRYDEALSAAQKAVDLQPSDPETHGYLAYFMALGGRPNEAIPILETAIRLSPKSPGPYLNYLGYAYCLSGNSKAAIASFNEIVPAAYSPMTYSMLILAYFENDNIEKAKETAKFARERFADQMRSTWIDFALKRNVDRDRFRTALRASGIISD